MTLSQLIEKSLILLSGKGGVGKTTVAICLALSAAGLKKNTLIVEMNSTERVAPYFGLKEIGHRELPLAPYLTGINLNPHDCFEEYVLMQIRFKRIFDTFINNRFVTAFLNAVPGLNELLMLGKIFALERQVTKGAQSAPLYDLIIVDGPATGHGVSAFEVPFIVNRAVRMGPIKKQSERMISLFTDTQKSIFCAVALSEEMPVVETGELISQVRSKLKINVGPVFLNNLYSCDLTDGEIEKISRLDVKIDDPIYPYIAYSRLHASRSHLNHFYSEELEKRNPGIEVIPIPHLYGGVDSYRDLMPIVDDWVK